MKEAFVQEDLTVQIRDSSIPKLTAPDQVLIKVIVSGSNPKDWKVVGRYPKPTNHTTPITGANTGDDIAGIVEAVGPAVYEFKPGDRVAAFHEMLAPHGSFAEYAIAQAHTTFHLPPTTTFEEAATLPLASMTSAICLYRTLGLPHPFTPLPPSSSQPTPLIIYGAASSVGFYALQLALRSNIHPLLCVAGRATDYIRPYLDPALGDVLIDYRTGDDAIVDALTSAIPPSTSTNTPVYALDAVSENGSPANIARVFANVSARDGPGRATPKVTFILHGKKEGVPDDGSVDSSITIVGSAHKEDKDFAHVYYRYMARGLAEGWFKGQRVEVVPGGLGGVARALGDLKTGKASGLKYVFRIGETEGVES